MQLIDSMHGCNEHPLFSLRNKFLLGFNGNIFRDFSKYNIKTCVAPVQMWKNEYIN